MILEKLSKRNDEWIKIALSICKDKTLANDLVQEMYLRIEKYVKDPERITTNDKISSLYIYVTIRNLYFKHQNNKKRKISYKFVTINSLSCV